MNKKQIKALLDYIDSQTKAMCTDDRKKYRKKIEKTLQEGNSK